MTHRPSNGEDGRWFLAQTCETCLHDHGWHPIELAPFKWGYPENRANGSKSCPILMRSLLGEAVDEWSVVDGKPICTGHKADWVCMGIKAAYVDGTRRRQQLFGGWESPYPEPPLPIHPGQMTIDEVAS